MSELYIKLFTSFFTHRKTMRLRARIGDDAYWVPIRLWTYAAENQIDGNFSSYTSEELAMLVGCDKHASSMLQALKDCGFVDSEGKIHDWEEHNGFHSTFSKRAKKAADARWAKKEKKQKKEILKNTESESDTETSIASSMLEASDSTQDGSKHADGVQIPPSTEKPQEGAKASEGEPPKKRVRFTPPSRDELDLESAKIGLPSDEVDAFVDYYAGNGWKVGRNPMVSWRHCLRRWFRTWRNQYANSRGNAGGYHRPSPAEQRNQFVAGADQIQRNAIETAARERAEQDAGIIPFM